MKKFVLELEADFLYRTEKKDEKEVVNAFLEEFVHIGLATKKNYDYKSLGNGAWMFYIEAAFEIYAPDTEDWSEENAIVEFFEELSYIGDAERLDYNCKEVNAE